jgi:flagellar hook-basal body complex protein FliE
MENLRIQGVLIPDVKSVSDAGGPGGVSPGTPSFSTILKDSIGQVNDLQRQADEAVRKLASGESQDIHHTMIAMEKASVSFELMMQVRNKFIAAYEEMMRMQV